jgi:hypothetical protein
MAHFAQFTKRYPAGRGFLPPIMRLASCDIGSPSTIPVSSE